MIKKVLPYFKVIVILFFIDAFARGVLRTVHHTSDITNSRFWGNIGFYMTIFIIIKSWIYYPLALTLYLISLLIQPTKTNLILSGLITAPLIFILYYLTTAHTIGRDFYLLTILYILFGAFWGWFRYKMMQKTSQSTPPYST